MTKLFSLRKEGEGFEIVCGEFSLGIVYSREEVAQKLADIRKGWRRGSRKLPGRFEPSALDQFDP